MSDLLNFKEVTSADRQILGKFINDSIASENAFVNLLLWNKIYKSYYAVCDNCLFLKTEHDGRFTYRLPICDDIVWAVEKLRESEKSDSIEFWAQSGSGFNKFREAFSDEYIIEEQRNAFDYIYRQSDLAFLSGKKYHSKRNHISSFSKKYDFEYQRITKQNIPLVKECAARWYSENTDRFDEFLICEKAGVEFLLDNMETLAITGGAIFVGGKVVAFTLGSPINDRVFDIHIEKALKDYSEAYTVINNCFAGNELSRYEYINREDDMGLLGLRKAKLSYKPCSMVKKYRCIKKQACDKEECLSVYREAFGDDGLFESQLFDNCYKYCRYFKRDKTVSNIAFTLPCSISDGSTDTDAVYIYAIATLKKYRKNGLTSEMLNQICNEGKPVFLRAEEESLARFYQSLGFKKIKAVQSGTGKTKLLPRGDFLNLCNTQEAENDGEEYFLLCKNYEDSDASVSFEYSMI